MALGPSTTVTIEGLRLLMTNDEAIAVCTANGWDHRIQAGDDRYLIDGPGIDTFAATFEQGRLVELDAKFDPPDAARAAAPLAQLPVQRAGTLMGRPWKAAWADDRSIVIVAQGDGRGVVAVHLGVIKSEREVRANLESYGAGLAPPARGAS